jgi:hypothetical protein
MEITKANWTTDGDKFTVTMPMSKIDEENRLVSGWASLDNVDLQGDIVTAEASMKAFSRFRGNIREMHQPIAVGRMVDYKPDTWYNPADETFYNGIYVTARISKGAEDTWQKVLDGTLSAFSIKGPIIESEPVYAKPTDGNTKDAKTLRRVLDYDLEELSLVDSGGNQYANVVSIMKVNGHNELSGTITDTKSENVFYCDKHSVAKTSTEDSEECLEGHPMVNIGWIEYDDETKAAKVAEVIAKHNSAHTENAKQELPATTEGGVDVAEDTAKTVEETKTTEVVEETKTEEAAPEGAANVAEVEAPAEELEKAADVSEVEVEEPDFAKMFGDLQSAITSGLEKNNTDATAAITKATEFFESKFEELAKAHGELTTKFDGLKADLEGVEKSLKAVESETALKKSGDLGGSTEENTLSKRKKSDWQGIFLDIPDSE